MIASRYCIEMLLYPHLGVLNGNDVCLEAPV